MAEKYNLNQLRGAYGAGFYAGKNAEEKVTLTFDEFRRACIGMFCETEEKKEYDCGINWEGFAEMKTWPLCKPGNCPFWIDWKKEGKIT